MLLNPTLQLHSMLFLTEDNAFAGKEQVRANAMHPLWLLPQGLLEKFKTLTLFTDICPTAGNYLRRSHKVK